MATDTETPTTPDAPTEPIHVDGQADLDSVVDEYDVVLTDFYADWCGPCQILEPVVERIADQTDAAVAKVDVDDYQQLAAQYGVRGVPTLVLFSEGKPVDQIVGAQAEDQLRSLVEQHTN